MTPFRLSSWKRLLGRRRARRQPAVTSPRPRLELLEDRVVPSSDAYTLYTYGDAYTGAKGQDEQTFLASFQSFAAAPGASSAAPADHGRQLPVVSDPGSPGPFAVTTQEYNLGNLAFRPTDSPWATSGIELTGEIKAPTNLGKTAHPVIVLLHGRHGVQYNPVTGAVLGLGPGNPNPWPPAAGFLSIPSYKGYEYLADNLASQGYVVVSIGANGINAWDNSAADAGALARAQLLERTLNILSDLNQDGVIRPRASDATHPGTDLFTGTSSPFGTRFVGKLDLQNVGLMGHSRGGEGVVRGYLLNQSLGSPYGIKAVFALAPIDFLNEQINNVPFAVLLPYNDGDVNNLQGAHFLDDSRYNAPGDTGPKFSIEVIGANHNLYNTVWTPGLFPTAGAPDGFGGTADDWFDFIPGATTDPIFGQGAGSKKLTPAQEQGTGLAYMSAFFRTYLGGETKFLPILTGDAAPPASAQVASDRIHLSYLPPDDPADRRDVNRLLTKTNESTNTLGGAAVFGGLATYAVAGPVSGEVNRDNQLSLGYSSTLTAYYENDLPPGLRDERNYTDLQFRVGVNWTDARNTLNTDQDFSVELDDAAGHSFSVLVSAYSNDLFYPPRDVLPHEVLNTVRIPLSAFVHHIDLSNVTAVRFNFDQRSSGAFQLADLAFADPAPAAGPYVVASTPAGYALAPQSSVRVQFDRPILARTFTTDSIDSFTRTVGSTVTNLRGTITGVTPVAGTTNQFDIKFRSQTALGVYSLTFGPDILDRSHRPMDQNHNLIAGEGGDTDDRQGEQDDSERRHDTDGADTYTATFVIQGLRVNASAIDSNVPGLAHVVHLTFNEPVAVSSLTTAAVSLSGPDGDHAALGVAATTADNTQFDVTFAPLTRAGTYTVTVQPTVSDLFGHKMDQDGNLIAGESTDAYTAPLVVLGPRVTGATGGTERPVSHVIVTFDRPMDPASFSTSSFALAGPGGNAITVTAVAAVSGTNNTQFNVGFTPSSAAGRYTLTVHAGVADVYGNVLAADAATTFTVNYTAAATAFQDIEIFGQAGTQTLTFTSGRVTEDDDFGTISLGGNSFNFYGQTYNQLFVSSNGVITFGGGTQAIVPTRDSRFNPALAYIGVYWTDLFKGGNEPMVVWRIDGDQLIIEWYRVTIFDGSPPMTFQAILQLNTGSASGDVVLNYRSVTGTGDQPENVGVTVGVKDAGTASDVARLLVEDGTFYSSTGSPLVQSGKAVRITAS